MNRCFFSLLVLTIFISCEKSIEIALPQDKPMPVMNSLIESGAPVYVNLSYSKPITEPKGDYPVINDAEVSLFVNDVFIEKLAGTTTGGAFYYRSAYKPAPGEKIKIEATISGFTTLEGETVVPQKPEIISNGFLQEQKDAFGNTTYRINILLKDVASASNFYQLRIFKADDKDSFNRADPMPFVITNLKTEGGGIFDDFTEEEPYHSKYFNDASFNGQTFELNIKKDSHEPLSKIAVELSVLSEDTYKYFKSIQMQGLRNDDPLFEKTKVFSNIKNGLGIVGSANVSLVMVEAENRH
ncbi:DUF4249 domain-containing protein [Elizabethkingia bruuniana]|uniref:DUF4249 domain-containing protein n=1 Tax=Elizabethkingia bruuniana TaxID=1756149 RepID=UPI0013F6296F|nr:DUF4249 domain-containing protein [Elizabethkingia bruuniana]